MPAPGEHKTVQARILEYAQEIGWTFVPRDEAERRRGFDPAGATPEERARNAYEVTEEFYVHNGRHGTREDVVFLINGIPTLVVECKNASKDEAIALGVDQIRRYHDETPEVMVPEMLFTATEAIGFAYGVTWNTVRRNIFRWKDEQVGNLEAKVKSFCAVPHLLRILKDFILFIEKDEELQKIVLCQHQTAAVDRVVARALDGTRTRGLLWHTQGSGKTFTMIEAAQLLFKAPEADKPTILLLIDRNELEEQMLKNLTAVGLHNVARARSIAELTRLLRQDYRGIVVTMIHKFRDMPADLPNATFIGFTGTPIDKTAYGKGTFKTFGCEDDKGYLHKYSIAEGIEELNKILDRAVNLKNFLKGRQRIGEIAGLVADHYRMTVEPLGYKAFLVAVDREACAFYKEALDTVLPAEYSEVVYTGINSDPPHMKKYHLDEKREKQIRKSFGKRGEFPKVLIVTEKLLTGFDAPILYAMYLDKPMRDHTLLQAIARVNRPYENEREEMVKPHGFVLDFVGLFDKLEKALAFDSDEVNAIVKDIGLLRQLFRAKMESKAPDYLRLVTRDFDDKDVDNLIEHFRDKSRRKEFFKEYKEIEMLYEIISPDALLRPFIENYTTLSGIYEVVRNAYARRVYVDRDFQRKTNELVQSRIGAAFHEEVSQYATLDQATLEAIRKREEGKVTKVINLVKAIAKSADEQSDDPLLIAMAERARAVLESFEDRQSSTEEALAKLLEEIQQDERRRQVQAEKGLDGLTYFVLCKLHDQGIANAEAVSQRVREAFTEYPNWRQSEKELRELRKKVTFAIYAEEDNLDKVTAIVDGIFTVLQKSGRA